MYGLLICDHQRLSRTSLTNLLEHETDMAVHGECNGAERTLELARKLRPDVTVIDGAIPGMGAIELCRRLKRISLQMQTVVLGTPNDSPLILRLLEAGADGYVTRSSPYSELVCAIRIVAEGERYISAEAAQRLALGSASSNRSPLGKLTPRELSVLVMVSQGQRRTEISNHLSLSPKTVSTYRSRVLKKLGLRSDVELTHLSIAQGLIQA